MFLHYKMKIIFSVTTELKAQKVIQKEMLGVQNHNWRFFAEQFEIIQQIFHVLRDYDQFFFTRQRKKSITTHSYRCLY